MINAVELEIARGGLEAIILEMRALIDRTAMSPIIKEKKDYFIGIYNAGGDMLSAHIAYTGPGLIQPLLDFYSLEAMNPGDVFWYNDPYFTHGAIQHLGDMCFIVPVFSENEIVAFCVSFGHFKDIGGSKPGSISPSATEIFHEGTRVPPIRIYDRGVLNEEAYRLFLANSRFPKELEGDTRSLMASSRLGETRLLELIARLGREKTLTAWSTLLERNEGAARERLRELVPEGRYEFWDFVDNDGVSGQPYKVDMKLERLGDQITVDLSASDPQAKGPINFIATHGFINLLFGRYLAGVDESLLLNEGLLRIIDNTITRPGTVVQPLFPAATGLRSHTRLRLSSCMLGIMNQSSGGRAPANSPVYAIYTMRFFDSQTGSHNVCSEGIGSGMGARPFADGTDAIYFIGQKNFPVEFIERDNPLRVREYGIHRDSGGPGFHRGGCGVVREIEVLAESGTLATRFDNSRFPCWGTAHGRAGRPPQVVINPGTPEEREVAPIGDNCPVNYGDIIRISACGGGGWGDPSERPVEKVLADARRGFISVDGARRDYGVVINANDWSVDIIETALLRADMPTAGDFDRGIAASERVGAG